jgi:molybdopterin biosynthesis enzyme
VIQVEDTQIVRSLEGNKVVRINKAAMKGQDVRPIGSDIM